MSAAQPSSIGMDNSRGPAEGRLATFRRGLFTYLHSPYFWRVQAMVGLVVVPFYIVEVLGGAPNLAGDALHLAVPMLYAVPIIMSGLVFRYEGARLTSILAALLVLPNFFVLVSGSDLGVFAEVGEISLALVVGLVLSRLLEREAAERRRVQDLSERLNELHGRLTQAQEDERRHIARELHDVTAQNLVLLCRGLDALERRLDSSRPEHEAPTLPELRGIAEDVLANVRRLSRELRPSVLDDLGLVAAARWHAGEVSRRSGLEVRVVVAGDERPLTPDVSLHLYRIVQETLHNVEKHARARQVVVQISFSDRAVSLTICDDGVGFDLPDSLDELAVRGNLGLVGMQERAHLVGGNLSLHSEPGKGTCCLLVVAA